MEASDYEIIKQCMSGNKELFSVIISRYNKLIYSVVYNMLSDKQDVNDVSQEVFIRIYKNLDKYDPKYKFSTWAVKIATNLCFDILRKKKTNSIPVEEIEDIYTGINTPEEKYLQKERREEIYRAVEQLPEKYRILIVLFHENGMSYEEMSKVLDQPMTIIKNRLYRARLMLRDKLKAKREEEVL